MTDFTRLTGIYVRYDPHPTSDKAQSLFNAYYAGELPEFESLFTDENRTDLKENAVSLGRLRIFRNQVYQWCDLSVELLLIMGNRPIMVVQKSRRFEPEWKIS